MTDSLETELLREVALSLAARNNDYPTGIPDRLLYTERKTLFEKVLFIQSAASPSSKAEYELFEKIVTDGLKISRERAELVSQEDFSSVPNSTFVVFLGEESTSKTFSTDFTDTLPGTYSLEGEFAFLITYPLDQIRTDQESKRAFWSHLQLLLPLLGKE